MSLLLQDARYAIRRLWRTPVFSLFAVAILALGIGLNVAVFGLVDALLLRPPPFADPGGIVRIYQDSDSGEPASTAFPAYRDIAAMTDVFSAVAASRVGTARWEAEDGSRDVAVEFATASYFPVLGLAASRGHWFEAAHDAVGDPQSLLGTLPNALRDVRPSLPVTRLEAFETYVAAALEAARTSALLMGAFAALALLLAGLGIYAAVSFSVERRTQEIGIRVALGATASHVLRTIVGGALKTVLLGVIVGLALAVVAAQGMQALLFGVAPVDAVSLAAAALLLTGAAVLAAFVPARSALSAKPSDVLRSQ